MFDTVKRKLSVFKFCPSAAKTKTHTVVFIENLRQTARILKTTT